MKTHIPIDPDDLDATRPVDLDLCPTCWGECLIPTLIGGEEVYISCWACGGTGDRGAA